RVISTFDIVLTDMQMTGTSGKEILQAIRETGSDIPVWLMTAYDDYTTEKALAEGFTGFITKPISMNKLLSILSEEEKKPTQVEKEIPGNNSPLSDQFPLLSAMFEHDTDTIKTILSDFVNSSKEDLQKLRELINSDKFEEAQKLCHRIHPFFVQLNAEHLCDALIKMDRSRGHSESTYPNWKEELTMAIDQIDRFRKQVREQHL
ncbi:MAG: response regulator, partial [Bacteroidales bacterium]|nr:response regulator [Bacteroidales bacterium]